MLAVPLVGIAVWAVVCAGWLRFVPPPVTSLNPQTVFISNERNSWITATGNQHPITAADYAKALSGQAGPELARLARRVAPGHQELLVITNPFVPIDPAAVRPGPVPACPSPWPSTCRPSASPATWPVPQVYLFDSYSLANPIGSHTVIVHHARPGHEKYIGPAWMLARFGIPGRSGIAGPGQPTPTEVAAARRALRCPPLSSYLTAITAPLTPGRFFSDIEHSFGYTTFSFSAEPARAAAELCGRTAAPRSG